MSGYGSLKKLAGAQSPAPPRKYLEWVWYCKNIKGIDIKDVVQNKDISYDVATNILYLISNGYSYEEVYNPALQYEEYDMIVYLAGSEFPKLQKISTYESNDDLRFVYALITQVEREVDILDLFETCSTVEEFCEQLQIRLQQMKIKKDEDDRLWAAYMELVKSCYTNPWPYIEGGHKLITRIPEDYYGNEPKDLEEALDLFKTLVKSDDVFQL